jgi:cyclopropane-fatty-acyl-phospholipid synthase
MGLFRSLTAPLLARIDVQLDGDRPWDVKIRHPRALREGLTRGSLGFGEAYVNGWWDCDDLEELVYRLVVSDLRGLAYRLPGVVLARRLAALTNRQTRRLSREVAERHYDFGNDLFSAFLGRYKIYSCGLFRGGSDLDEAQLAKLHLICKKLDLRPGERLLDVGGGWGEIARFAAEHYGARVTSINISEEQMSLARERCRGLDVEIVRCDYRSVRGTFDKIMAIAMFTHVGPHNYRGFMETMHRALAPGGVFLMEGVWGNASQTIGDPWVDRYIFPNAVIPSGAQTFAAFERLFVAEDLHNFGPDYALTLRAWNANFQAAWPSLRARYDERTRRLFEYYFLAMAALFRARAMQNWHLVLTKAPAPQPPCRRG